jgi:adenylate cyclase
LTGVRVGRTSAVPAHDQQSMLINYRAPAHAYRTYEARHLLHAEDQILAGQKPDLDPAVFKNKIVFVGLFASGLVDVFSTPFGGSGTMPGIQVHAAIADSILSDRFIEPLPARTRIATVAIVALAIGLLAVLLPLSGAAAASAVLLGGWTAMAVAAFDRGLWLNLSQPVAAGAVALFAGTGYRYLIEGRERRKIARLFARYVSKDVYAHLLAHPESAELGGARRDMTVLFSDIRGFTTVTENGEPEALVAQLNEYFSRMVDVVFRHHGTLDKFVGDMVMALYGAPLDDPEHAEHAVQTAVAMIQELGELNNKWRAAGAVPLDIGIGINSGEMIAGNIGSSAVMSYTAIGDNVNLGSRLESLNKDYGSRIIISDATRSRLTGTYDIHPLGHVTVKGKSRPVAIYELQVPSPLVGPEGETPS